jgi:hypothetical protein
MGEEPDDVDVTIAANNQGDRHPFWACSYPSVTIALILLSYDMGYLACLLIAGRKMLAEKMGVLSKRR